MAAEGKIDEDARVLRVRAPRDVPAEAQLLLALAVMGAFFGLVWVVLGR